jgi:hypothetical protein
MPMAKKKKSAPKKIHTAPTLFAPLSRRHHRVLILPRLLRLDADNVKLRGAHQEAAFAIIKKWAQFQKDGHLAKKKETALDAGFFLEIFGEALGYKPITANPQRYELERNFTVPGVGTADGALGLFGAIGPGLPSAVIEFKDAGTDLDAVKFNGRTTIQQLWD